MAAKIPGLPTITIIYLVIRVEDYSPEAIKRLFTTLFALTRCSTCGAQTSWSYHGQYTKYHGSRRLIIIRLRCQQCGRTHAIMPSFSLPYTSLDTASVEGYFRRRHQGESRRAATKASGLSMYSQDFSRRLEKRLTIAVIRAKATIPDWGDHHQQGYQWLTAAVGPCAEPLVAANQFCLEQTKAPFFGGTVYRPDTHWIPGRQRPHKKATGRLGQRRRNSG